MKNLFLAICLLILTHHAGVSQTMHSLCSSSSTNGGIIDFAEYNGQVYATGLFTDLCNMQAQYLAVWKGGDWFAVDPKLTTGGNSLEVIQGKLYTTRFQPKVDSNWLLVFDETLQSFEKVGHGFYLSDADPTKYKTASMYDVIDYNGKIVVCGEFDWVGNKKISGIAQWDGVEWSSLGEGIKGNISNSYEIMYPHNLMVHDGKLYVAGNFLTAGDKIANGVASWNGTEWEVIGKGFNRTVYSLAVLHGELYAAGDFTESDTQKLGCIAKWNGLEWISPGFEIIPFDRNSYSYVHTMKNYFNKLYIGGGVHRIKQNGKPDIEPLGLITYDGINIGVFTGGFNKVDIEALLLQSSNQKLLIGASIDGGEMGLLAESNDIIVSINDKTESEGIHIFPNPTSDYLSIQTTKVSTTPYHIYNSWGLQVWSGIISNNQKISVSHFTPGLYTLQKEGRVKKFIIR